MTDVRKIPWRLPAGYEDLKYFWDEFIKKLGVNIDEAAATGITGLDGGAIWVFDGDCGLITEALSVIFNCGLITDATVVDFDCGTIV